MKISNFLLSTIMMFAASAGIAVADKVIAQELAMDLMLPDDVEGMEFTAPEQMYLEVCAKEAHNKYFGSRAGEFDIDVMEVVKTEEYILEDTDDVDQDEDDEEVVDDVDEEDGDEYEYDDDENMDIDEFDEDDDSDDDVNNNDRRDLRFNFRKRWKNRTRLIRRNQPKRTRSPTPAPTPRPRPRTSSPTVNPPHPMFRNHWEFKTFWAAFRLWGEPKDPELIKHFLRKRVPSFMRTMAISEGKCKLPCPQYPDPKKNRNLKKKKNHSKKKKHTEAEKKLQKKANTMFCDCARESPFPVLNKVVACRMVFKDAVSLGNTKTSGDGRDGDNE